MQRMHHAAIPGPDVQNSQRTSFSEAVTLVQISADHVEDMLMCDRKRLNGVGHGTYSYRTAAMAGAVVQTVGRWSPPAEPPPSMNMLHAVVLRPSLQRSMTHSVSCGPRTWRKLRPLPHRRLNH